MNPNCSPCKGCEDRHTACHDHCEKYAQWKAMHLKHEAQIKEFKRRNREDFLHSEQCETAKEKFIKSKSGKIYRRL